MKERLTAHDKDIREPLFEFLEERYGKVRIIEEKRTGKARADAMMVTDEALYGIEIKSDNDTYVRLEGQVKNYNLFYDFNIVAVGSSHAGHIKEYVPEFWGIITIEEVDGRLDFYVYREPLPNPKVKPLRKLSILWRPELAHIQEKNNLPKYKEKSKRFVQDKILEKVPPEILWKQVSEELFERDYTLIEETISSYKAQRNHRK